MTHAKKLSERIIWFYLVRAEVVLWWHCLIFFCPKNVLPFRQDRIFMNKIRIDKWLWSIRIFKSRTLATDSCKGGKVKVANVSVKPSYQIGIGEVVVVKKNGFNFEFKVVTLIEKRVGAAIAVNCYEDVTPEAEKTKYAAWYANATPTAEKRERGTGRPTKKERREIDDLKVEDVFDWGDDE